MIRLSHVVASSPTLVLYADSDDPGLVYFIPTVAELSHADDGRVKFEQRMCRMGGATSPGLSWYSWTLRVVVPDAEVARLIGEVMEARKHRVSLSPAPLWSLEATLLIEPRTDVLACLVLQASAVSRTGVSTWAPSNDPTEVDVHVLVRDTAEPEIAQRLMSPTGLELSLDCRVTGATTPFQATLHIDPRALRERFGALCSPAGFISWSRVVAEVERLMATGAIGVRTWPAAVEAPVVATAVARQVINRLMRSGRLPALTTPFPAMDATWFRLVGPRGDERPETLELTEFDLETRVLSASSRVRSVPASAFHGLDGTYEELTPEMVQGLAGKGIIVGDGPGSPDHAVP
jgi:hypothetical protein